MKITKYIIGLILTIGLICCSDDDDDDNGNDTIYGEITVALDANKSHLRGEEALLGNIIADSYKEYTESKEIEVDFAIINGGAIRFSAETREDGIYPAGQYTDIIIEEIFPWFDSKMTVVEVTGAELKAIFEHSVSSLPAEFNGWFLQLSKEISVTYDLSKTAQISDLETTPEEPVILTPGERVISIKINNVEYVETHKYKLVTSDWIADGEDGFVTLHDVLEDFRTDLEECSCEMNEEAFKLYLQTHTPIAPTIEGRITFATK